MKIEHLYISPISHTKTGTEFTGFNLSVLAKLLSSAIELDKIPGALVPEMIAFIECVVACENAKHLPVALHVKFGEHFLASLELGFCV